jgi:hypothetical protein
MDADDVATGRVDWDDPELKAAVDWLVNALTGRDETTRRGVAAKVAHELHPAIRARVVGLLADRLGSGCPGEPDRAAEALLGVGPPALSSLLPRLLGTDDPAARDRLVAVVAGIGGVLPEPELIRLLMKLDLALGVAGDWDAARAVARVMVRLRNDGPPPETENPAQVEMVVAIGARQLTGGWQK